MAKKKKKSVIKANFKDVQVFKLPPEGNYKLRVEEAEMETSSNDNDMIALTCEVAEGKYEGSKVWHRLVFSEGSLWRAREALEAMGIEVPDGEMEVDPSELIGCEFGAELLHETYEGKKKAVISEWLLADEVEVDEDDSDEDEDEDEEDKPKGKSKKSKASSKKSKKEEPEEDEEDEDDDIDVSSMDEDELEELIDDKGLDVDLDDYSSIKKKRKAVQEALESDGEEDEDEDEEDEDKEESDETTYTEDQIKDMSQEDLEELNDDLELGIDDLDEMTKKTARRNVIKALKKKGLFEE